MGGDWKSEKKSAGGEKKAEKKTEKKVEKKTEKKSEKRSEKPSEKRSEKPSEKEWKSEKKSGFSNDWKSEKKSGANDWKSSSADWKSSSADWKSSGDWKSNRKLRSAPAGRGKWGDALKEKRRRQQEKDVKNKVDKEIDFFWDVQGKNAKWDAERGGPPRKGRTFLDQEEEELFTEKAGMAAGIDFDKYDDIEVEINGYGADQVQICDTFEDLGRFYELPRFLKDNIWKCHYERPTPVQKYAIPCGIEGHDIMVCAQTGSGKTAAFLCPVAMALDPKDGCESRYETWEGPAEPLSLVLAPTRELCSQIYTEARKLFHRSSFKVAQCYGGVEVKPQLKDMSRGCDVLIATPGRLLDFTDRGVLSMAAVQFLVLDEADRMLDMGFEPQIRKIVEKRDMPAREERQTMMFSATFPREIQHLAGEFLREGYIWTSVGRVGAAADTVEQAFIPIYAGRSGDGDKMTPLYKELELMELGLKEKCLVFVGMKRTASWLASELWRKGGYQATEIHGDLEQPEREKALEHFKTGDRPVMVATEVAARGLDIPKVAKVINFDMPTAIDDYVHRIGRTGRVGNRGVAVSFFRCWDCR
eukprot:gene264-89_t